MRKIVPAICGLAALAALVLSGSQVAAQQPPASPPAKAECKLAGGKSINVDYSSPRMRGRKIYGELVPFGQVWRTGANAATTFVTTADLNIAGKAVPAGKYTMWTVPAANERQFVISKQTGMWGTDYPGAGDDLLRAPMKVSKLPSPVENFTIAFTPSGTGCTLNMDWEATRASIQIAAK